MALKRARPGAARVRKPRELDIDESDGPIGEMLVARKYITKAQLNEALLKQSASRRRLGRLLVEAGALDERDLAEALADVSDLPVADLGQSTPDPEAVALMPERVARTFGALPLEVDGRTLTVAVSDPSERLQKLLSSACGRHVDLQVATASGIARAIDRSYRALAGVEQHIQAFEASDSLRRASAQIQFQQSFTGNDAPVVNVVNLTITQGIRDRASDIHVEPQDDSVIVRYRIDGALHDVLQLPANIGPALVSRIKILSGMNIVEKRRPQDGQMAIEVDGRDVDIRVSTATTIAGEKAVLRLLDKSRPLYKARDLGMPEDTSKTFLDIVRSPFGMVVCTGPTGSGKTTTLYATLAEINDREKNIVTIEDPVEYVLPSVNQFQINEAADVTFASGLRSILRQDPDIILVGEIRDAETARIAVQSALTGHLVLSSMHATDAAAALHRFLDMGLEAFLIASSVRSVVGQRLVRRICTSCAEAYRPSPEEMAFYRAAGGPLKRTFLRGVGCNFCVRTGYLERIGVYELLVVSDEMKALIVDGASHQDIRALAIEQGMRTMRQEAVQLVADDVTTISEVVRTIYML
jgi:type IV pilus assembly protein PilB